MKFSDFSQLNRALVNFFWWKKLILRRNPVEKTAKTFFIVEHIFRPVNMLQKL